MSSVDNPFPVGRGEHELVLGSSFDAEPDTAFHTIRYDFKPASVDTSQMAMVEIGEKNQVTIEVPNIESSGTTHTVYKGNKRPCSKECVLIYDHNNRVFTLERLNYNIQLKKTRIEGSSRAQQQLNRPLTPIETIKTKDAKCSPSKPAEALKTKDVKNSPSKPKTSKTSGSVVSSSKQNTKPATSVVAKKDSFVSSSTSSDSETEKDSVDSGARQKRTADPTDYVSMLNKDLQLSESESDSESNSD